MTEPVDPQVDAERLQDTMRRIRGLLGMAEGQGLEPQARENYRNKAMELLAKYGIDMAMLEDSRPQQERPGDRVFTVDPPFALVKADLLHHVASCLGGRTIRIRGGAGNGKQEVHVFAFDTDLERIDLLFTSLLVQIATELAGVRGLARMEPAEQRVWKRSWLIGYTNKVAQRLAEIDARTRRQAETDRPGTDLVLVGRQDRVQQRFTDAYPVVSKGRRSAAGDLIGYLDGQRAGERADLGQTRMGQDASGRKAVSN